ncbi:unnamed protein product [Ceratitis capitata]|uniref:(Mediterranean fruit fly) hypothetical protein n=1 Tax=Ceratitis capitata TaxID=7213 RepID=A0A811VIG1_CERCA|nr:unnamed protein product [Ceratitis capitata]
MNLALCTELTFLEQGNSLRFKHGELEPLLAGELDPLLLAGELEPLLLAGELEPLLAEELDPLLAGELEPLLAGELDPLLAEELASPSACVVNTVWSLKPKPL